MKNESQEFYKSKTGYSLKWNSILSFSNLIVSFFVGIVLARLLDPEDFGLLAMVTVFVAIISLFINAGTGSGLIQKKEISQADLSTVFFYNIGIGFIAFILLFILAGPIATFYDEPAVKTLVRVLGLSPLIASFSIVQMNLMSRTVRLKNRTLAQLGGQIGAAMLGIGMALTGFGVWALVGSNLASRTISTVLYWVQGKWRPSWTFSKSSFQEIWGYSSKILYGNILAQVMTRLDLLIVAKFVGADIVGLFFKGRNLGRIPATSLGTIITKSYFPILSRMQDDLTSFRQFFNRQGKMIAFLTVPIFMALTILSVDVIIFLFGAKWEPAGVFLAWTAISGFLYANNAFKIYACNALGRSDLTLRRSKHMVPVRIVLYVFIILILKDVQPIYFLYIEVAIRAIQYFWVTGDLSRLLETFYMDQIILVLPYLAVGILSTVPAYYSLSYLDLEIARISVYLLIFIPLYLTFLYFIKDEIALSTIQNTIKKIKSIKLIYS
ncbi:MAG: lipopolysaccharide biosynthesis protein [Bacteroidota bacterium]